MAKNAIRIECNPYTKRVSYYWRNDGGDELWSDLSENKSSPFAKSKSSYKGFAEATIAHKAYEILSVINSQYNKGKNGLEIFVDGTKEDLDEFCSIIDTSFSDSGIECKAGDLYMLTAKEVMPQIEDIYASLSGILSEHSDAEIRNLIEKYSETVKPEITLCVMGLYSSGKSAFINSLIGKEILPSASDPATAKIYKINSDESVWVEFRYDGVSYRIDFFDSDWKISRSPDAEMVNNITEAICKTEGREKRLYVALKVLNEYAIVEGKNRQALIDSLAKKEGLSIKEYLEKNDVGELVKRQIIKEYRLADLIEIGVPINSNSLLPINDFKFVIFDTPGSNSEMHKEHVEILKKSLEDRTNGLPIFVTNADTLDNTDNVPIINMIETLGESLDGTSTMIVVNKADEKSKKALADKREKINDLKVTSWKPSRIYFVSSIVSLGQKIEDPIEEKSWLDQEYADLYYDNYEKFDGSDDRKLLELYRYNIVPSNVQDEVAGLVEKCSDSERILWNAGIKSIEFEIGKFGEKFALYNKCVQADKYLEGAIAKLKDKIAEITSNIETTQKEIEQQIDDVVKSLEEKMNDQCQTKQKGLNTEFSRSVVGPFVSWLLDTNRIRGLVENAISNTQMNESLWKEKGLFKRAKNSTEYSKYVKKTVSKKYDDDIKKYVSEVNEKSDSFWEKGIEELKEALLRVVYASERLSDEQKEIAKDVVMKAGKMQNSHAELIFGSDVTAHKQFLWVKWDEFDDTAACTAYKVSLQEVIERKNVAILNENTSAFNSWKKTLIDALRAKLSLLNPTVVELNRNLVKYQEREEELKSQLFEVEKSQRDIRDLLSFKEAE